MKLHLTGLMALLLITASPMWVSGQERATQIKGPKNATSQFSGTVYGPIDAQDTLWRIANRYRQNKNLSVYQVMVAIYELNPDAFEQNNLNLMVDGAMLKLPSERYIARIDAQKAQQRAESDDDAMSRLANAPGRSLRNIKPPVPLVNQDDLSTTKQDIEQKITRLDDQQTKQFEALRDQFAASLNNVQSLLDENRKLYDRVDQVNTELESLRTKVQTDVQSQMDEQLTLQRQMVSMFEDDQRRRKEEEDASFTKALTSPAALITLTSILSLGLVGGLIFWLLKRKESQPVTEQVTTTKSVDTYVDDDDDEVPPPAADLDDFAGGLGDDFDSTAELSDDELFNDDDLLDDVLSTELEDELDGELENFAELDDDMLVPDDDFESGDTTLDQDELDSLFDDDDLTDTTFESEFEEDIDGIDLSTDEDMADDLGDDDFSVPDDESDAEGAPEFDELDSADEDLPPQDDEFSTSVDDASPEEQIAGETVKAEPEGEAPAVAAAAAISPVESQDDEKPEISIDELLHADDDDTPDIIATADNSELDEEMLDKLDKEIDQQNQDLDRITDNIISEIEQLEMMGGLVEESDERDDELFDEDDDSYESGSSPQGIQSLDALAEDLDEVDVDNMENAGEFDDPLSDDLIAELQSQDEADDIEPLENSVETDEELAVDDLSDELLAELGEEDSNREEHLDALSDELLDELGAHDDIEEDSVDDELTNELLAELGADTDDEDFASADEETDLTDTLGDELLAELEADTDSEEQEDEFLPDDTPFDAEPEELSETDEFVPDSDSLPDIEGSEADDDEDDAGDMPEAVTPTASDEFVIDDEDINIDESGNDESGTDDEGTAEPEDHEIDGDESAEVADETDTSDSDEPIVEKPSETLPADTDEAASVDPLEAALDEFDRQLMDDIPSFGESDDEPVTESGYDDDVLNAEYDEADDFSLEQEQDGVEPTRSNKSGEINELDDVPGLDDWLTEHNDDESDEILDEFDNADFDELLSSINSEASDEKDDAELPESLDLGNPDLDLDALLNDAQEDSAETERDESDFVDVDTLMDETMGEEMSEENEPPLDLDVSLSDYSGIGDDDDVIDIDKDAGQSANLDLARVYIEMEDFDAARELLNEVIEGGSEEQKEEARKVLASL